MVSEVRRALVSNVPSELDIHILLQLPIFLDIECRLIGLSEVGFIIASYRRILDFHARALSNMVNLAVERNGRNPSVDINMIRTPSAGGSTGYNAFHLLQQSAKQITDTRLISDKVKDES